MNARLTAILAAVELKAVNGLAHGGQIVATLSRQLSVEHGASFDEKDLPRMLVLPYNSANGFDRWPNWSDKAMEGRWRACACPHR